MDRIPLEKQAAIINWEQALYILGIGESVLRNHILHSCIAPIGGYDPLDSMKEYSFTACNMLAYIETDIGGFLEYLGTTAGAKRLLFEQIGIKLTNEEQTETVRIDQAYNPETASHADKLRKVARLEIENKNLPKGQRRTQAELSKELLGTGYSHQDPTRQYRALRDEAIRDGLILE